MRLAERCRSAGGSTVTLFMYRFENVRVGSDIKGEREFKVGMFDTGVSEALTAVLYGSQ